MPYNITYYKPLQLCLFFLLTSATYALTPTLAKPSWFYIGGIGGYSSTTWGGLVPARENQNMALKLSTPTEVAEGGLVWGAFTGYEFSPHFAIEASYINYPNAKVTFDDSSLFSFTNDGQTTFMSHTQTLMLMAKLMLFIPHSTLRFYSSAGIANMHRDDLLVNDWRLTPTFAIGINQRKGEHLLWEINGNYTAGYGESQLNPTETYFPFLYSITLRIAYGF